ncbi:ion-channel domain-containing protein [Synechococcus sp. A18-40]|nr:ion-channel domain-containing protein [Synechococcus sp. A18-40]
MPHRHRWWIALVAAAFALTLALGLGRPSPAPPPVAERSDIPAAVDWGTVKPAPTARAESLLQVGAYITNISDIDLMDDQFSIELLLWTVWHGELDQNPSDQLRVLNGIYNGDISALSGSAGIRRMVTAGASTRCVHWW